MKDHWAFGIKLRGPKGQRVYRRVYLAKLGFFKGLGIKANKTILRQGA